MRYNKIVCLALSLIIVLKATSALAASSTSMSEADLASALQKLTTQTAQMQQEINSLKEQLRVTKEAKSRNLPVAQQTSNGVTNPPRIVHTQAAVAHGDPTANSTAAPGADIGVVATQAAIRQINATSASSSTLTPATPVSRATTTRAGPRPIAGRLAKLLSPEEEAHQEQEEAINFLIGSTVLSSPILNIHSAYDASDLIVNQSTMNEDLRFLMQRQELEKFLGNRAELPSSTRPRVFLSGKIEAQALYFDPFGGPASTAIELSSVELDVLAEASPWAYGFMSINFENNPLRNPETLGSGNPINNSRLFLKRGFLTIGNLDKTPFYFSMGQMYVPFGDYSSYMLSNPVTISEGRINNRAALFGFYHSGVYLSTYVLNGAVNTPDGFDANHVYEWGVNAGWKYAADNGLFKSNIGAGFVDNIAEAQGYQINGVNNNLFFQGFSAHPDTEVLDHPVGGFDIHASAVFGPVTLLTEFVTATTDFADEDLSFNNRGAQPSALHIETDYTFKLFDQAFALYLAYDRTWESLALNLPENSYVAGLSTSIWKNTIQTLEYRHDVNYPDDTQAGGICDPTSSGVATFCPVPVFGPTQNQIIFQIGVYF